MGISLEQRIVDLAYSGQSNAEICNSLGVGPDRVLAVLRSEAEPSAAKEPVVGKFTTLETSSTATIGGALTVAGDFGCNGATAAAKQAAYTKTYSTASRVIAAPTAATVVTTEPALATYGFTKVQAEAILTNLNALVADALADKKNIVSLVDDSETFGFSG